MIVLDTSSKHATIENSNPEAPVQCMLVCGKVNGQKVHAQQQKYK